MRPLSAKAALLVAVLLAATMLSQAQTFDNQSAAVITAASVALGPGQSVNDITLTGSATHFDGTATDSGSATLKIKGADQSRIDLAMSNPRSEIRTLQGAAPKGSWNKGGQPPQPQALHNMLTPACWASPLALIASLRRPGTTVVYVAQEQRAGVAVDHLRISFVPSGMTLRGADTAALVQRLSTYDLYVDAASHLPVAIKFFIHPDKDLKVDIPGEIQFSNYTKVNGVFVPFHIQRLFQKTVNLDFTVSSVAVNTGLADSDFTVQ
jgi:hypothetical protein